MPEPHEDVDKSAIARISQLYVAAGQPTHPLRRRVVFNHETWRRWFGDHSEAQAVLAAFQDAGAIERADLLALAQDASGGERPALVRLFVATMIWGSGTTNGRGPRFTREALSDARLVETLGESAAYARSGEPGLAYISARIRGVGPPFFTKWLWASCLDLCVHPTPLILDSRVWESLGALGWDSSAAAGSRRWGDRYRAYLDAMERWATGVSAAAEVLVSSEVVEWCLFEWIGGGAANSE